MYGVQPTSLTHRELVHYAWLQLREDGLDKVWSKALIEALESCIEERDGERELEPEDERQEEIPY